ncbi:hypothetical protein PISMIDRAFT_686108 [Pisolithus microcarpus 441]|uniref:Uncharacterized protein n=1 Tax=Pisolithus microcarpus 441 TaxID=765257 RepID=A0A0C9XW91_9AGAM|nr:hypothetical protein PISMIDRAFT_686108 [Pisolithus microcarpus 441]
MTRVEYNFSSQQIEDASRRNNKRRSVDAKGVHPGGNKPEGEFSMTAMMLVRGMTPVTRRNASHERPSVDSYPTSITQ